MSQSQPDGNDHVFTHGDVWEYLKIAFDLESAANTVLEALQEGRSIAEAERAGVDSYRANHVPDPGPGGPKVPVKGRTLPSGEMIMALALAKLFSEERRQFENNLRELRYPMNTLLPDEQEELRQKIERRLSTWSY